MFDSRTRIKEEPIEEEFDNRRAFVKKEQETPPSVFVKAEVIKSEPDEPSDGKFVKNELVTEDFPVGGGDGRVMGRLMDHR